MTSPTKSSSNSAPSDLLTSQPRPFTVGIVNALSYLRAGAGFACILAPTFTGRLFQLAIPARSTQSLLLQLFGVRDLAVGEMLWFVKPNRGNGSDFRPRTQPERQEIQRVLWMNVAIDSLDLACLTYAFSRGALATPAFLCVGGGAAFFAALGAIGLREV